MNSDPIADMLTRIKNGYLARLKTVNVPYSKMNQRLGKILGEAGFLKEVKIASPPKDKNLRALEIILKYQGKTPALTGVTRISKPSLRIFAPSKNLSSFRKGLGVVIVSTPKGLMTHREAQKLGLGGEIICRVW